MPDNNRKSGWEGPLERALFNARWLLAPFYMGMVVSLGAVLVVFLRQLVSDLLTLPSMGTEGVILMALTLIDLSLTGNLILIVVFAGYENFVSKIDTGRHEDRPAWMGTVDFSGLKMKLIASIVAISAIALLRAFLPLSEGEHHGEIDSERLGWMVGIHMSFVVSGVLLALMDFIAGKTPKHVPHQDG